MCERVHYRLLDDSSSTLKHTEILVTGTNSVEEKIINLTDFNHYMKFGSKFLVTNYVM